MKRIYLILLLILSVAFVANSTETKPTNFGIYGGLNINMHSPNFTLGSTPSDFQKYSTNATGLGFNIGAIGNYPISNNFTISGRLGYNGLGGADLKDTSGYNTLMPSLGYLEISPILQIHNLVSTDDLYFLLGFELGIPITKSYSVDYNNGITNTPNVVSSTDIPNTNSRFAIALGAGLMYKLSKSMFLTPEISLRIPLTKVATGPFDTWSVPQIRLSVALTFALNPSEDTVKNDKSSNTLDVKMKDVRALDRQGKSSKLDKIKLEENQYTELFPLVPFIFFAEGNATPNDKLQILSAGRQSGAFNMDELEPDAMLINKYTLDIIGTRMNLDKNISIKLIGTNDGKSENKNSALSLSRASFAKEYLTKNYGISDSRINLESTNIPSKPSSIKVGEGIEENRRVEIVPLNKNTNLLEPIMIQKERQRLANPELVEFLPLIETNGKLANWDLEVMQSDRLLRKFSGTENPENIQWAILPNELSASDIPIDYTFTAYLDNGTKKDMSGTIPVEYFSVTRKKSEEIADKTISKFSLILFDFDSPEISENDKKIIEKYIIPSLKFNSTIQIYGYTDNIGDETYNKKLALQRSTNVKNLIQNKLKEAKYEVYGVGEGVQIYDNQLPTGRQLSRTVQVVVTTPKN